MKEKITYIADDGKEFSTKEACEKHEKKIKMKTIMQVGDSYNFIRVLKSDDDTTLYVVRYGRILDIL